MPITEQVFRILFEGARPADVLDALLSRRLRPETWSCAARERPPGTRKRRPEGRRRRTR